LQRNVGALFLSSESLGSRGEYKHWGARRDRAEVVAITIVLYWIAIELRHVDRRRAALGAFVEWVLSFDVRRVIAGRTHNESSGDSKVSSSEAPSLEALVNGIIDHDQFDDWFWDPIYYDDFRLDGAATLKAAEAKLATQDLEHVGFELGQVPRARMVV